MFNIESYISALTDLLSAQFGERLLYVGLQGSYLRGEATENSDIDIMVVLDELTAADMDDYRDALRAVGDFERSCGFICGREDLANWNPLEIWSLCRGTKDHYGELSALVPACTEQNIRNFAKLSLNNLYHELCHRYIHGGPEKSAEKLAGSYKSTFFILQTLHYLSCGEYIPTKAQLLPHLEGDDRAVLERAMELNRGISHDFHESFSLLFHWCQRSLRSL